MTLQGKIALVTGAAGGIGLATARLFAAEGARVVMADLDRERLDTAAATVAAAVAITLDVTDNESWNAAVAAAVALGGLHVLVNNAGISEPADIETITDDAWDRHVAINLTGVMRGMRAAAPAMRASGGGSIVNVASMLSIRPGAPFVAYCASKAGMAHMSKSAALHFANNRIPIRVNTVHPGAIITPMLERYTTMNPDVSREASLEAFAAIHPMGRVGEADEVARAILYLASDASSFTTGAELPVDGGGLIRD